MHWRARFGLQHGLKLDELAQRVSAHG
jgi:hypothetical protein